MKRKSHDKIVANLEAEAKAMMQTINEKDALIDHLYRRIKKMKRKQKDGVPEPQSIVHPIAELEEKGYYDTIADQVRGFYPNAYCDRVVNTFYIHLEEDAIAFVTAESEDEAWDKALEKIQPGKHASEYDKEDTLITEPQSQDEAKAIDCKQRVIAMCPNATYRIVHSILTDENGFTYVGENEDQAWIDCYEQHVKPRERAKAKVLEVYPEAYVEEGSERFLLFPAKNKAYIGNAEKSEGEQEGDAWLSALRHINKQK